jgi:hypothetical protein
MLLFFFSVLFVLQGVVLSLNLGRAKVSIDSIAKLTKSTNRGLDKSKNDELINLIAAIGKEKKSPQILSKERELVNGKWKLLWTTEKVYFGFKLCGSNFVLIGFLISWTRFPSRKHYSLRRKVFLESLVLRLVKQSTPSQVTSITLSSSKAVVSFLSSER